MSLTVQELRDYVRTSLDTDDVELPNDLLDIWREEAEHTVRAALGSSFTLRTSWSLSTTASDADYPFADWDGTNDVEEITSVEGERWLLDPIPHEKAVAYWANYTGTDEPTQWSVDGTTLYLWPTPDASYSLTIRGHRLPAVATDAGSEPDCPAEFHALIGEWMLARAYEQQDDEIMSTQKFSRFEQQLERLSRRYRRSHSLGGIRTVGGKRKRHPWQSLAPMVNGGLLYDWD